MNSKKIYAYISLDGEDVLVGKLWCHYRGGRESASFEYSSSWIKHPERFALEPALSLTTGSFHTQADQSLFGAIGDSAPDRWGRVLMRRAESAKAKQTNETSRSLGEADYLLGVNDQARQGALRFSLECDGEFLSPKEAQSIPPLISLPELLSASERFIDDDESAQDLKLLLAPGSSLGGARPKASVWDRNNQLSIAKFPRKDDEYNVVLWEAVALTLAENAGINTPKWKLETILEKSVLIINRFDREDSTRIPFLSAMSMLGAKDNEQHSYLELAYALAQHGGSPDEDMAELWRRIVFSILISNTDDHLRNHGFIYQRHKGWRLSPLYDVNPTPLEIKPRILTTTIDFDDGTASLDLALSVTDDFRVSSKQAKKIIQEVAQSVSNWRNIATQLGLNNPEINRMASAFEHQDLESALKM